MAVAVVDTGVLVAMADNDDERHDVAWRSSVGWITVTSPRAG